MPLGIFPETEYDVLQLTLQPQDLLIFASDGILESMNAHDEEFGFERLAELLRNVKSSASSKDICAAILAATDKFSGRPEEPHDDRTLVVLRVTGS